MIKIPKRIIYSNYYWIIANSTTEVFSSASASFVPVTDPTYVKYLADNIGHVVPSVPDNDTLIKILTVEAPAISLWNLYSVQQAQALQTAILAAEYDLAIIAPVEYTSVAGTTAIFSQDAKAKENLQNAITGATPSGIWDLDLWLDVNNVVIKPFTFADLEGLAAAMKAHDIPEYKHLLDKISLVHAANTIPAIKAIAW